MPLVTFRVAVVVAFATLLAETTTAGVIFIASHAVKSRMLQRRQAGQLTPEP